MCVCVCLKDGCVCFSVPSTSPLAPGLQPCDNQSIRKNFGYTVHCPSGSKRAIWIVPFYEDRPEKGGELRHVEFFAVKEGWISVFKK